MSDAFRTASPDVFLDFEASSLSFGSYPIEVGLVATDGREYQALIRPQPDWTDWSPGSEKIHGISRATLMAEGQPADMVARQVLAFIGDSIIYSDAPTCDDIWMRCLLTTINADVVPKVVGVTHAFVESCHPLLRLLAPEGSPRRDETVAQVRAVANAILEGAISAEQRRAAVRHRALPDAQAHKWVHKRIRDDVSAFLANPGTSGTPGKRSGDRP
jgi:DNA polymerase III epsilon subunit-like protein